MIRNTVWWYIFIQACIFFLHYIAPLSLLYCAIVIAVRPSAYRVLLPLEIWALAEAAFYLLVYLPRSYVLQRAANHPTTLSREERRNLFELCHKSVPDAEKYLSLWFRGASTEKIKRDNVKEFFCWAFLNKGEYGPEEEEELDEYADKMEEILGRKLEPGRGPVSPLRLTLDKVSMLHRSLLWYLCVSVVDSITYVFMIFHSFHFHRLPLKRFFTIFPFRLLTITSLHHTPAKTLAYWHRPHTSKSRMPILFIHGIGIGLYPYVDFLSELNRTNEASHEDGEVGIIAIEIMPISFRITSQALQKDEMCVEILRILKHHNWDKCVLITHSYGSVLSTHLLKDSETTSRIGPVILVDPVSFLLHLPDVAYNFTFRKPRRANEHQLYYFASMDMGVAHSLSRRFFWAENILWKHNIKDRRVTVALSGVDLIVDTEAVGRYLTKDDDRPREGEEWKKWKWRGRGLDVLWYGDLDHAQVFDTKNDRNMLIHAARRYCLKEAVTDM